MDENKEFNKIGDESPRCTMCGTQCDEKEDYCPVCGTPLYLVAREKPEEEMVPEEPKKKKRGTAIKIMAVMLVLALFSAGGCYLHMKAGVVADIIEHPFSEVEVFEEAYDELTIIGQFLYRGKLTDALVQAVRLNPYSGVSNGVVNKDSIGHYKKYKAVADKVGITCEDNADAINYIDTVLTLEKYMGYNSLYTFSGECVKLVKQGAAYLIEGFATEFPEVKSIYVGYAYDYSLRALNIAREAASDDEISADFVNKLENFYKICVRLYRGDESASLEMQSAIEAVFAAGEEAENAFIAAKAIEDKLFTMTISE